MRVCYLIEFSMCYLIERSQYLRLKVINSDTLASSTGAPQFTVLAPLPFTLYASDFDYNSEMCHLDTYKNALTLTQHGDTKKQMLDTKSHSLYTHYTVL